MIRRSSRGLYRRLALALSLMLLAGALAVPAVAASDVPVVEIISPSADQVVVGNTLYLEAKTSIEGATLLDAYEPERSGRWIAWAVRSPVVSGGDGECSGDMNNLAGDTGRAVFDGEKSFVEGVFTAEVDISGAEAGPYCFVFRVVNAEDARVTVNFTIDPLADFDPDDEIKICEVDEDCSITVAGDDNGQSFTASTDARGKDDGPAFLGLRIATGDGVAEEVRDACNFAAADVNRSARLGPEVFQLVPVNFAEGSITVQSTIPRKFVNESSMPRGAGIFQVCIAPDVDEYGGYGEDSPLTEIGQTGLYGPVILDNCDETSTADHACVLSKTKVDGDVVLTYQLPTEDPWGMS